MAAKKKKKDAKKKKKPIKKKVVRNKDGTVRKKMGRKASKKKAAKKKVRESTVITRVPTTSASAIKKMTHKQLMNLQHRVRVELIVRQAAKKESEFFEANLDLVEERQKAPIQFDRFRGSLTRAMPSHRDDHVIMGSYLRQMLMNPQTAGHIVVQATVDGRR